MTKRRLSKPRKGPAMAVLGGSGREQWGQWERMEVEGRGGTSDMASLRRRWRVQSGIMVRPPTSEWQMHAADDQLAVRPVVVKRVA